MGIWGSSMSGCWSEGIDMIWCRFRCRVFKFIQSWYNVLREREKNNVILLIISIVEYPASSQNMPAAFVLAMHSLKISD